MFVPVIYVLFFWRLLYAPWGLILRVGKEPSVEADLIDGVSVGVDVGDRPNSMGAHTRCVKDAF